MERPEFLRQMIAEYQKRIDLYQAMIAEWEKELGAGSMAPERAAANSAGDGNQGKTKEGGPSPVWSVREWQFYGKSQPEAAKQLLEMVKHPLSTASIMEGLEKGGVKVGGKTEQQRKMNLYTILNRSDEFVRIARDTWALQGWPGVPKKGVKDEPNGAEKEETAE
jgi:hypothetical protein